MTPQLFLSPSLQSARAHIASDIQALQQAAPLHSVFVLLPTVVAIRDTQQAFGDAINIHLLDFYRLGRQILDSADSSDSELSDVAIRRLVHSLLLEMHENGELTTFAVVWEKPGFVQVLVEWLREMKTQGIFPEEFSAHIRNERDQQLAILYERYQSFLQTNNYSDTEGLLWLATEALESDHTLFDFASPLYVLGFDQFTPIERRILQFLANRLKQFSIYLVWDEQNRSEDSLALTRLRATRDDLVNDLQPEIQRIAGEAISKSTLVHLRHTLFEPLQTVANDGTVQAITAPSREAEVRWALRQIKKQLLNGTAIDDIALITPNPIAYSAIIDSVAAEYGVPVALERPLSSSPVVQTLLSLLNLAPDFAWRPTFEALHSPYINQPWLSNEQIDYLDRLTRERPVVSGRNQWQYALVPLDYAFEDTEDEDLGPPPLVATHPAEELRALQTNLMAFFDHITPPQSATYADYTLWLQEAILGVGVESEIESLHMIACCLNNEAYAQRDLDAMQYVLSILRSIVDSAALVPGENDIVPWATFRDHLVEALASTLIQPDPAKPALQFGSLYAARAHTIDHLYILGLSEGELPRPPSPDTLYDPVERENHPLPLMTPIPAESASVWWQVICNAQQSITLLRPRIDEKGAPWQPSPYWQEVVERIEGLQIEDTRIDPELSPAEAASQAELMIALSRQQQRLPAELAKQEQNIQHAFQTIRTRKDWDPSIGIYEGVLKSEALKEELRNRYSPSRGWSASRLNRYGTCPFIFFAEHVLKLKNRGDPETGLDALQRGSLLHAILEQLYRNLTKHNITPAPDSRDQILKQLDQVCDKLFSSAPKRYGFRPGALWDFEQDEMRRMLAALVTWECEQYDDHKPYLQEMRFGLSKDDPTALELKDANGTPYKLHGVIDRIDRDDSGNLRIIDYKSGSTRYSQNDIKKGLALQSVLYALAAKPLLEAHQVVHESCYLHIPIRETSGKVQTSDQETIEEALFQAGAAVAKVRGGYFPVAPHKVQACNSCDFETLCRVNRQSIWKAMQQGGM